MPRPKKESGNSYSCVSIKLNSLLSETFKPWLAPLFDDISYRLSRIVFEAYILANLHLVRCLTDGIDLPALNQSFFYSCCSNVSASTRSAGDEELRNTAEAYFTLRPGVFDVMDTKYLTRTMASHAKQMETMARNHIVLNLVSRLCDYVRLKYVGIDTKRVALSFIRYAVYEKDDRMLTDDVKDFRHWLGAYNPFLEWEVEQNLPYYVKKLNEILLFYDTLDPNTKGLKRFSLLPLKGDYVQSHFFIDSSTLPDLLKLLDRRLQEAIVSTLIPRFSIGSEERVFLETRLQAETIFDQKFQQMKLVSNELWRLVFNVKSLETSRRKFANRISTDGCSASVYLQVPGQEPGKGDGGYSVLRTGDKDIFSTFIGIDPGRDYVCSAFAGKFNEYNGKSRCVQVSTQELRHDSKMIQQKKWMRKQTQRHQEYGRISTSLPTLRIGALQTLAENIRLTLASMDYLFRFQRKLGFRNWRFKTKRFGEKALTKAVRKILDGAQDITKVLVGFGDWSEQDCLKGTEKAPVKKMRKMLGSMGAKVIKVDEYRTSKCCSHCMKGDNENVRYNDTKCHRIIRCNNSECKTYWNRDVNGSRNIRSVLMSMVLGESQRPAGLRRSLKRSRTIH